MQNYSERQQAMEEAMKPKKTPSPLRRVLQTLSLNKNKNKGNRSLHKTTFQNTHRGRSGAIRGAISGANMQFPPVAQPGQPFMPQFSTHSNTQDWPALRSSRNLCQAVDNPLPHQLLPSHFSQHRVSHQVNSAPQPSPYLRANPQQYRLSGHSNTLRQGFDSMSFFSGNIPQSPHQDDPQPQDDKITLGGQLVSPNTNRMPSTFLTPTNDNSYAIAGKSRIVSGRPVESHHAAIFDLSSQTTGSEVPSIFAKAPVVRFAIDEEENTTESPPPQPETCGEFIPGIPFSLDHLDAKLVHPGHRNTIKDRTAQDNREMRRSASVPTSVMMRGSAIPPPLEIKKKQDEPKDNEEAAVPEPSTDQSSSQIKDDYIVAAFDGVHRHLEDVRGELAARMEKVEEKMDRVLAVLAASAAAAQQQQKKKKQQQHQQQQREIRPNLVGPPPHIPFGGMEGWYKAVKK